MAHAYIPLICQLRGAITNETPLAMILAGVHVLVSNILFSIKRTRAPWKMTTMLARNVQDESRFSYSAR